MVDDDTCSVEGCSEPITYKAKRWCNRHYKRARKNNGDPRGQCVGRDWSVLQRLAFYTDTNGPLPRYAPFLGSCHLWTGNTDPHGYAKLNVGPERTTVAHRLQWEEEHGLLDREMVVDHLCRVRNCVRLEHLEPVTHLENVRRGKKVHLSSNVCGAGHDLTDPANVYQYSYGRICRICRGHGRRPDAPQ